MFEQTFKNIDDILHKDVANIDAGICDLAVKNPNGGTTVALRAPEDILDEIDALDAESAEVLATIRELV